MNWEILEKVVRFKGSFAHTDVVINRNNDTDPFIYAVVDETRDKAIVFHANCESLEEAKLMAAGSLQTYDALQQQLASGKILAVEDGLLLVGIRTEYGDKYEPVASSGSVGNQLHEIISSATDLLASLAKE